MPKREVKRYTEEFKREAVTYYREHGRNAASKQYHVAASTVDGWVGKFSNGPAKTLFKVEGLQDFNINGLLSVMQARFDELMGLAQEYDNVIKALKSFDRLEQEENRLREEKEEHAKALTIFMKEKV